MNNNNTIPKDEICPSQPLLNKHTVHCHSVQKTKEVSLQWLQTYVWTRSIILLYGEIGSGKSTFIRFCLEGLGLINSEYQFSSPSFSLVHKYPIYITHEDTSISLPHIIQSIQHIDLYRLHNKDELYDIDIFSEEDAIYFVEWPNRISYEFFIQLQIPITTIYFTILDENIRNITFTHPIAHNKKA